MFFGLLISNVYVQDEVLYDEKEWLYVLNKEGKCVYFVFILEGEVVGFDYVVFDVEVIFLFGVIIIIFEDLCCIVDWKV